VTILIREVITMIPEVRPRAQDVEHDDALTYLDWQRDRRRSTHRSEVTREEITMITLAINMIMRRLTGASACESTG
jgi:hypothetical protein